MRGYFLVMVACFGAVVGCCIVRYYFYRCACSLVYLDNPPMKKIYASKEKAQELARRFGISSEVVNSFSYEDEKMETEPKMDIVKEADQSEKNKNVQVNHDMQKIGKKIATSETKPAEVGGIAVDRLRSLIERIERLEEEKAAIASDIRDIFAEAKSAGFDVKIMRMILKLRKMNAADRDEQEILLKTYAKALDM